MKILPSFSKRAYILSGTLLALAAVFLFYFLVHVPKQEELLYKQRERALNQVVKNFQYTYDVYKKNAEKKFFEEKSLWRAKRELETQITRINSIDSIRARTDSTKAETNKQTNVILEKQKRRYSLMDSLNHDTTFLVPVNVSFKNFHSDLKYSKGLKYSEGYLNILSEGRRELLKEFKDIVTSRDSLSPEEMERCLESLSGKNKAILDVIEKLLPVAREKRSNEKLFVTKSSNNDISNNNNEADTDTLNNYIILYKENIPISRPEKDILKFVVSRRASDFMRSVSKDTTVFQAFILYREDSKHPTYQSLHGDLLLRKENSDKSGNAVQAVSYVPVKKGGAFGDIQEVKLGLGSYILFPTSFSTQDNEKWYLYGLVSKAEYERASRAVPPIIVTIYGGALLLLLFSMPLLKVAFMSKVERLHQSNIIQIAVSLILTFSLIVLGILSLDAYIIDNKTKVEGNLKRLSDAISTDFAVELDNINTQMSLVDDNLATLSIYNTSLNIKDIPLNIRTKLVPSYNIDLTKLKDYFSIYPYFNYMFWMNSVGVTKYEVATVDPTNIGLDEERYTQRPYFKFINEGKGWSGELKGESPFYPYFNNVFWMWSGDLKDKNFRYYIQSINSWNDGSPSAVIAMPSRSQGVKVVALSTQLYSLMDPILPPGYEFYVIDKRGNVLFNSDKSRNLQQNLLEESGESNGLTATLLSNTSSVLDLPYNNKNHQIHIRPLPYTPWHLVISYDDEYSSVPFSQIILLTLIYIVLLSALVGIITLAMHWLYLKSSKLKRREFLFEWFRPLEKDQPKYLLILMLNIFVGGVLILYNAFVSVSVPQTFASFATALCILYGFTFAILTEDRRSPRFWCFLGFIFLILLCVWFLLINLIGSGKSFPVVIGGILLCITFSGVFFLFEHRSIKPLDWLQKKMKAAKISQVFRKIAKISLLGGARGGFMYIKRYSAEVLISFKNISFKNSYLAMLFSFLLINGFLSTIFLFSKIYQEEFLIWQRQALYQISNSLEQREGLIRARYAKGLNKDANEAATKDLSTRGVFFTKLGYAYKDAGSAAYQSNNAGKDEKYYEYLAQVRPHLNKLITNSNGFSLTQSQDGSWASTIDENDKGSNLLLTHNNKPYKIAKREISAAVPFYINGWKSIEFGNVVFFILLLLLVVVLYYVLKYIIRTSFTWDLLCRPDIFKIKDLELKRKKEDFRLLQLEEKQEHNIKLNQNPLTRLKNILFGLYKVSSSKEVSRNYSSTCNVRYLIDYECGVNSRLIKLEQKPSLIRLADDKDLMDSENEATKEEVVLKIQRMAQTYYFSLWNACSKEEKYILHDLAEDGFANTKNINTIILLVEKGLIYYTKDEQLRIMNESFRNFILTDVQKSEALAMENERVQQGTFSIIRSVVIVVLVGTLFFISFAERSILDSFSAILVALAAVVPALLRLGGWFGTSSEVKA